MCCYSFLIVSNANYLFVTTLFFFLFFSLVNCSKQRRFRNRNRIIPICHRYQSNLCCWCRRNMAHLLLWLVENQVWMNYLRCFLLLLDLWVILNYIIISIQISFVVVVVVAIKTSRLRIIDMNIPIISYRIDLHWIGLDCDPTRHLIFSSLFFH